MTTPGKGDYGLGLRISKRDGRIVIDHGGGIEGFNTYLGYEPEKRITVVVLGNVNGIVPEFMGLQLLEVASGKIVILPTERKPMPIQLEELMRFEGEFRLPSGTSIVMAKGDQGLTMRGSGSSRNVFYEGTTQGRAKFYDPTRYLEIEFVSNDSGLVNSVVLHFSSGDQTAQRK